MNRNVIRRNITSFSIIIFIILYTIVLLFKPAFIFKKDGNLRNFGIGFRDKTVIPAYVTNYYIGYCVISFCIILLSIT